MGYVIILNLKASVRNYSSIRNINETLTTPTTRKPFGIIARSLKGGNTPKIAFMSRRFNGFCDLIVSLLFLRQFLFLQSTRNILFDFEETLRRGHVFHNVPVAFLHWLGLLGFIVFTWWAFASEFGSYRCWFIDFKSLSDESKKSLMNPEFK